jgi:uncharacterized protein
MAYRPFAVNVAVLRRSPGTRQHEWRRGRIEGLAVTGSLVPAGQDTAVDADLEAVHAGVVVTATVETRWVGECRRCLTPVAGDVRARVRELYEPGSDGEETYPLYGDQLDLALLARDAVVLELPQVPLCREDCQGLCPYCGANRNEIDCGHDLVPTDPRWAALDALRTEEG